MNLQRNIARKQGQKFYIPTKPCKRGHLVKRYVINGGCPECLKDINRLVDGNRLKAFHDGKLFYVPLVACEKGHFYRRTKDGRCCECDKLYQRTPACKAYQKKFRENNKGIYRESSRCHVARIKNQTPKWVDRVELKRIVNDCPDGMVIDHIVPLGGKIVSGLNVPWNLQYLTPEENLRKLNKFPWPEQRHDNC